MEDPAETGEPVAIVGLACHFPGARDAAELHELTLAARRMFRPLPLLPWLDRPLHGALLGGWAPDPASHPGPGPLRTLTAHTIAMALDDAGIGDLAAVPVPTQLIIASTTAGNPGAGHPGTDLPGAVLSGLLSEELDAGGADGDAGEVVPDAFLSSLHAVCAGCTVLATGKAGLVIAGGAEVGVAADWLARQATASMLGTSEMRVYDAEPAGLLPGDGCGILVLMRSACARAAGMPVYAEIIGWGAVPQTPDEAGPALRRVYELAGIDPGDVQFIEGSGTGTATGELAELSMLADLRQGGTTAAALGAVSASLGYLGAAGGAASLIKTVGAMVAGVVPPGTGCSRPHQLIESGAALLRLPAGPEPWPQGTRMAAVNSPGTADPVTDGAHLVLRRAPEVTRRSGRRRRVVVISTTDPAGPEATDACVTASSQRAAKAAAGRHAAPRRVPVPGADCEAATDAADTAGPAGPADTGDAVAGAGEAVAGAEEKAEEKAGAEEGAPAPIGPPRAGHPRVRACTPAVFALCGTAPGDVAAALDEVALSARELGGTGLGDLSRRMAATALAAQRDAPVRLALTAGSPDQLAELAMRAAGLLRQPLPGLALEPGIAIGAGGSGSVAVAFPGFALTPAEHSATLFAGLAGLRGLERLGVTPAAGAGYSLGELTGLVWAGCLTPADAARFAAQRGHLLRGCGTRPAAMARLAAGPGLARRLCERHAGQIVAYETPMLHLITGPPAGIRELAADAARLGIEAELLPAALPLHSPAMARCAAPLRAVAASIPLQPPRQPLASAVSGQFLGPTDDIAELLANQLASPVLFSDAIALAARGADLVLMASPGPASGDRMPLTVIAAAAGVPVIALPAVAPPAAADTTDGSFTGRWAPVLGALFAAGVRPDLAPLLSAEAG